jgi:hypothetical protein
MRQKIESALRIIIILLLVVHVFTFLLFSFRLLVYPYDWEPSESDHILYATRLLNGESLYKDDNSFPLLCMNYPPGYHLLLSVPVKLLGPHMYTGRIFSMVIAAGLFLLIYKIIVEQTDWKLLGIIMAVALLAYGPVSVWLAIIRMDSLYVVLSLAAMYLLSKHEKGYGLVVLASAFLAYSFFTKQQGIFGLGAGILYLLTHRKYRECGVLFLFFALFTVPLNLGLDYMTAGWYNKHLFGSHFYRAFSWQRMWFLIPFFAASSLLIAFSCLEIFHELKTRQPSVWTCYLLGTLPVAFLIFYDGTAENYFLPLFSGLLIMAAMGLRRMALSLRCDERKGGKSLIYFVILLQLITFSGSRFFLKGPEPEDTVQLDAVAEGIRNSVDPVLVDRMNSLIIGTPHEAYFLQPVLLKFLYDGYRWDPDVVVSAVNERRFSLICVFDKSQLVRPVQDAIRQHYVPASSFPIRTFRPDADYELIVFKKKQ